VKEKPPPRPVKLKSVAVRFREAILATEAAGVAREDMTLRLTMGDAVRLRRDASLPIPDLSFEGGVMRFVGVKVLEGGVAVSVLEPS
jgi:hypothetical protein